MVRTVAIIHARGGSKRLPRKNLLLLAGKPLLAYPIELCRQCNFIDRIIVSTDDDEIMSVALSYGAEVPFRRPADISEDVPSEIVTEHALKFLAKQEIRPEFAVTLTPATPFTTAENVCRAFDLLVANPAWDAVTAVRRADEHPEWMLRIDPSTREVTTVLGNPLDGHYNVSQNLPQCFYPTGAFWVNRVAQFLKQPSLYGRRWGAVVLDSTQNIDIDTREQFERAAAVANKIRNS